MVQLFKVKYIQALVLLVFFSVVSAQNTKGCITMQGFAKNENGVFLPGAELIFTDQGDVVVKKITVDENSAYSVCLPMGYYKITGVKEGYNNGYASVVLTEKTIVPALKDVSLTKGKMRLFGRVRDWASYDALKDVKITLVNKENGIEEKYLTSSNGDFVKDLSNELGDSITYDVLIQKDGYRDKIITYTKSIDQYGKQTINYAEDLYLYANNVDTLATVPDGSSEELVINPIYFKSNSYLLNKEAKMELDKVVALMNKYPSMEIEVGSHTDCEENRWYNEWLSYKRAKSSRRYIKYKLSQNSDRITGKGYGEYRLLNGCRCEGSTGSYASCSGEEHAINRRTEFRIINKGEARNVTIINNSPNSFERENIVVR